MADTRKSDEIQSFNRWKKHGEVKDFQDLYVSMKPLLYSAARKASFNSNIPESAHMAYAAQNFYDALKTFKPTTGASLQTHVYGAVHQKAKRLNYMYQNLGHMPEPRATKVGLFQSEQEILRDDLGRDPTARELADKLNWPVREVESLMKEIHKDLAIGEGTEEVSINETPKELEVLDYLYFDLSQEEQQVYDHVFGKHGRAKLRKAGGKIDFEAIAGRVGYSSSKVRTVVGKIKVKLEKAARK